MWESNYNACIPLRDPVRNNDCTAKRKNLEKSGSRMYVILAECWPVEIWSG